MLEIFHINSWLHCIVSGVCSGTKVDAMRVSVINGPLAYSNKAKLEVRNGIFKGELATLFVK